MAATPTPDAAITEIFENAWQGTYVPQIRDTTPPLLRGVVQSHLTQIHDRGASPLWHDAWRACEAWHAAHDPK